MRNRNKYTKYSNVKADREVGRFYKPLKYPEIPLSRNDMYVITLEGDRLDLMADQFYKDSRLWWIIAQANPEKIRRNSYSVKPGIEIRIPREISLILNNFKSINK